MWWCRAWTRTARPRKRVTSFRLASVRISDGDELEAGDLITEGFAYPQDILAIKGPIAVQNYLISEVQKVYRLQGVDICDKTLK